MNGGRTRVDAREAAAERIAENMVGMGYAEEEGVVAVNWSLAQFGRVSGFGCGGSFLDLIPRPRHTHSLSVTCTY